MRTKFANNGSNGSAAATKKMMEGPAGVLTANQIVAMTQMMTNRSVIASRARLLESLGKSYDGLRDLYNAMGYKKTLIFNDYEARFTRQGVARRVVTAFPNATWARQPEIVDDEDPKVTSAFEKDWDELKNRLRVFHYMQRADVVSGIGSYGALFLGLDDGEEDLSQPVTRAKSLIYLQPYSQRNIQVGRLEEDITNPRFSLPIDYNIHFRLDLEQESLIVTPDITTGGSSRLVHWTRVIHIADLLTESDIFGTPRMQPVYNDLTDLELVSSGSAEMFWKGAFPGISFEMDAEADKALLDTKAMTDQLEDYFNTLSRYLKLQGVTANQLSSDVHDPDKTVDSKLKLISAGTTIPQRILTGSEAGELASSQDEGNWNNRVNERREQFAEPVIIRALIDRLVDLGVLSTPQGGPGSYAVRWPNTDVLGEDKRADIAVKRTEAMGSYIEKGADQLMAPLDFLTKILEFDIDQAEAILEAVIDGLMDEGRQTEEDLATIERERIERERESETGSGHEDEGDEDDEEV